MRKKNRIIFNEQTQKAVTNEAAKKVRPRLQSFLDRFSREHRGRRVERIKSALRREWRFNVEVSEDQLSEWAQQISNGDKAHLKTRDIRFNEAYTRDLEEQAFELMRPAMQNILDRISRHYRGRPIDDVKSALQEEWRSELKTDITDPELTDMATRINRGKRAKIK